MISPLKICEIIFFSWLKPIKLPHITTIQLFDGKTLAYYLISVNKKC